MFLYWRIQQDLHEIGECLIFLNPSLSRCYRIWVKKHRFALAAAEDIEENDWSVPSMN